MDKRLALAAATCALALGGCASTYQLTLMPRDSGRTFTGTMQDGAAGEGRISIDLDGKAYTGTWVQATPEVATGWVSGGLGFGRRARFGGLSAVTLDNPQGGESKALLTAADGSGLRCDLRNSQGRGAGLCRDDKGREYDVQIRLAEKR